MFNKEQFVNEITNTGFSVIPDVFPLDFISNIKKELESAIEKEIEYHGTKNYPDFGMVLLCALYNGAFIEIFNYPLFTEPIETILGEGCIVYAYTSSSMPPYKNNFSSRIHVDTPRLIPNYLTNFAAFIAISDIDEENGAMYFLPASHTQVKPPLEEYFFQNAHRCILKAGSVFFFNPRLWHAGGNNNTDKWRHALTLNLCRPYMKQRIDIPRALNHLDISNWTEKSKQKLGFFSQTPANYDEYYVEPALRKYKQKYE